MFPKKLHLMKLIGEVRGKEVLLSFFHKLSPTVYINFLIFLILQEVHVGLRNLTMGGWADIGGYLETYGLLDPTG